MMGPGATSLAATTLALWRNIATARWAVARNQWQVAFAALAILQHIEHLAATPALRQSAASAIASLGREISRAAPNVPKDTAAKAKPQTQERRP